MIADALRKRIEALPTINPDWPNGAEYVAVDDVLAALAAPIGLCPSCQHDETDHGRTVCWVSGCECATAPTEGGL